MSNISKLIKSTEHKPKTIELVTTKDKKVMKVKKTGRPTRGDVKSTKAVSIYLTEEEFQKIDEARGGTPRAAYIRELINNVLK
jgi:hypothetical protein